MLLSAIRSFARWREQVAMRLKWRDYPALLTHSIMFLAGTMVVRIPPKQTIPQASFLLYPLEGVEVEHSAWEAESMSKEYMLVRSQKDSVCRWSNKSFRLWRTSGGKERSYLLLDKRGEDLRGILDFLRQKKAGLRMQDARVKACQSFSSDVQYEP